MKNENNICSLLRTCGGYVLAPNERDSLKKGNIAFIQGKIMYVLQCNDDGSYLCVGAEDSLAYARVVGSELFDSYDETIPEKILKHVEDSCFKTYRQTWCETRAYSLKKIEAALLRGESVPEDFPKNKQEFLNKEFLNVSFMSEIFPSYTAYMEAYRIAKVQREKKSD